MRLYKEGDIVIFCSSRLKVTMDQVDDTINCKDSSGKKIVLFLNQFLRVEKKKKAKKKKKKKGQLTVS